MYECARTRDVPDTSFSKAETMHFRQRLLVVCVCSEYNAFMTTVFHYNFGKSVKVRPSFSLFLALAVDNRLNKMQK